MTEEAILYREVFHFLSPPSRTNRSVLSTALDLPRPLARSVVHFYSLIRSETVSGLDDDLADQIARSLSEWFVQLWRQLETNIRDAARDSITDQIDGASKDQLLGLMRKLQQWWPDRADEWDRGVQALATTDDISTCRGIVRKFAVRGDRYERERCDLLVERALRLVTTPLADHLNESVPTIAHTNKKIEAIFRRPGTWNIFDPIWPDIDWNALETVHDLSDNEADLAALAQRLVRGIEPLHERMAWQRETRTEIRREYREAGYGDIQSLHGTNSPQLALPAELSLLAYPETEPLFLRKAAENGVLALAPRRLIATEVREEHVEWNLVKAPLRRGPVVVCVDTSGSMSGVEGDIASATVLLLVQEALQQGRSINVVATRETLHVASFEPRERPIESHDNRGGIHASAPVHVDPIAAIDLASILSPSTVGGADIAPALESALDRTEHRDDHGHSIVDFVVISDIQFPRIGPSHLNRIHELQSRGWARFHAITINRQPLHDPLHVFDYRWHYNTAEELDFRANIEPRRIGITNTEI